MKGKSFTAFYKTCLKVLSVIAIVVLAKTTIERIHWVAISELNFHDVFWGIFFCVFNAITILCFAFLFFFPDKLPLYAMVSLIYGLANILNSKQNGEVGIGFSMLLLFFLSLWVQGFFKTHRKLKICLSIVFFILILLCNLFFGFKVFESILIYVLGYCLIFFVIILMFSKYQIESTHSILGRKILDLRKYVADGTLSDRDVKWLKQILNNEKYSSIAKESAVAEGTMRNKMRAIFKIIGVTDRKQFLTIYTDALVITTQEEFQAWKDTLI